MSAKDLKLKWAKEYVRKHDQVAQILKTIGRISRPGKAWAQYAFIVRTTDDRLVRLDVDVHTYKNAGCRRSTPVCTMHSITTPGDLELLSMLTPKSKENPKAKYGSLPAIGAAESRLWAEGFVAVKYHRADRRKLGPVLVFHAIWQGQPHAVNVGRLLGSDQLEVSRRPLRARENPVLTWSSLERITHGWFCRTQHKGKTYELFIRHPYSGMGFWQVVDVLLRRVGDSEVLATKRDASEDAPLDEAIEWAESVIMGDLERLSLSFRAKENTTKPRGALRKERQFRLRVKEATKHLSNSATNLKLIRVERQPTSEAFVFIGRDTNGVFYWWRAYFHGKRLAQVIQYPEPVGDLELLSLLTQDQVR